MTCKRIRILTALIACAMFLIAARPATAQERMYFSAVDNVRDMLVQRINAEMVRIDMSAWYLTDRAVTTALLNKFKQGVPVRLMGDRGSIFEIDPKTKAEFYRLAAAGMPIRLRFNPTWYPEIVHWKATIFVGQNLVSFGSANYTPFELAAASPTNYKDESVLLSNDPELVAAFKTQFDRMWNDTTVELNSRIKGPPYYLNWDQACAKEAACADYKTLFPNPIPMIINTERLEGDAPMPSDMVWGQGPLFNNRLVQEIKKETTFIDFVIYRLTVDNITEALLAKHKAGVPVRIILEPNEYRNRKWPEFWITHANMDKLWAAGVQMKMREHDGLTHMKMLVTSAVATNASSNLAAAWQRDHNYFVPAARKPDIYNAMRDRFQIMWNDPVNFSDFVPEAPDTPTLATPAQGSTGVSTTVTLTWNRAPFATAYAVYLGTASSSMTQVGVVQAKLVNDPPLTYTWTTPVALEQGTTYFWKVVALTNATDRKPELARPTVTWNFTTGGPPTLPQPPSNPVPADLATAIGLAPQLSWSPAAVGTTFAIDFGTSNPPPRVATGLTTASWTPAALAANTTYFWRVTATSSVGSSSGPIWSFTTGSGGSAPATPINPFPASGATAIGLIPQLSWSQGSPGTTFTVDFGTSNPPPQAATGLATPTWTPGTLAQNTTYFWRVTASLNGILTTSAMWSFTTGSPPKEIVLYASDFSTAVGAWSLVADPTAANALALRNPDAGAAIVNTPLANPAHYFEATFDAVAGTRYRLWVRMRAAGDSKFNDSAFVQFSDSVTRTGSPIYRIGTTSALTENLWTCGTCQTFGWGWSRHAYWLSDTGEVWFQTSGTHRIRIQVREDGVDIDQIVISPLQYVDVAPGPVSNDTTIVPQPTASESDPEPDPEPAPSAPSSPNPAMAATVNTSVTLTWTAAGATSYDVNFGTADPPPTAAIDLGIASYMPGNLAEGQTYYWQVIARNSNGSTAGPVWSFTTAIAPPPPPPSAPSSPNPAIGASVNTSATLTWSAAGATSYDLNFGTTNPPPSAATGLSAASFTPSGLAEGQTYYWQVMAHNNNGTTAGPIWSFTTTITPRDVVIYASDVPLESLHGGWTIGSDVLSPLGTVLVTPDLGVANTNAPLANPTDYIDVTFDALAGVRYAIWLRLKALNNSKFNDAVWVQFSDALVNGSPLYRLNTTSGLLVNLASDANATSLNGWGWQRGAYWLNQPTSVTFATSGTHTLRIQIREDGVQLDQIVLSPSRYLNSAPGPLGNDSTIVPKP